MRRFGRLHFASVFLLVGFVLLPIDAVDSYEASKSILSSYSVSDVSDATLEKIAREFEVTDRHGSTYEVLVPAHRAKELEKLAPNARLNDRDIAATLAQTVISYGFGAYRNYDEVTAAMESLAQESPQHARVVRYGKSRENRPLMALKVAGNIESDAQKPQIMITAATHGDEIVTTEVLLRMIEKLVRGYGSQNRFKQMIDGFELYFIPVVNADGFVKQERYDSGRDPNRSYPYPGGEQNQPTASIRAVMDFFKSKNFVASLDFHAFGRIVMSPWAYTHQPPQGGLASYFDRLTTYLAATNGYRHGRISEVITIAQGSSADYYHWQKGSASIAIEIGAVKAPPPQEIPRYQQEVEEATWRFIENFAR